MGCFSFFWFVFHAFSCELTFWLFTIVTYLHYLFAYKSLLCLIWAQPVFNLTLKNIYEEKQQKYDPLWMCLCVVFDVFHPGNWTEQILVSRWKPWGNLYYLMLHLRTCHKDCRHWTLEEWNLFSRWLWWLEVTSIYTSASFRLLNLGSGSEQVILRKCRRSVLNVTANKIKYCKTFTYCSKCGDFTGQWVLYTRG